MMRREGPLAVVVTGPPGVGKTTTAVPLAVALGAALLDLDTMTNGLVDLVAQTWGLPGDYADPGLARLVREPRYRSLLRTAQDCLRVECPVVLVAPFTVERSSPKAWGAMSAELAEAGGTPVMVWLRADEALVRRRLVQRSAARDLAKVHLGDQARIEAAKPASAHVEVDAALSPEHQVEMILAALSRSL